MLARRLTRSRSRSRTCAALRGFSPAASSLPCLLTWRPVAEPVNCADLCGYICDLTVTFFCQLYCLLCDSFQVILSEAAWVNLGFVYPDKEIFVPLIRTWNLKVFVLLCMRKIKTRIFTAKGGVRMWAWLSQMNQTRLYLGDQHWNEKC